MSWIPLNEEQLSIVDDLDNMDKPIRSDEAEFLENVMKKLEQYGDDGANFSQNQIAWLIGLKLKYLDS